MTNINAYTEAIDDREIMFKMNDTFETLRLTDDTNNVKEKGVYVYKEGDGLDWIFERYDTFAEAIKRAIKVIGSIIIHNGKEVKFKKIDKNSAYYIDNDSNIKVVKLK